MGRGRKPSIPENIKFQIIESVAENMDLNFINKAFEILYQYQDITHINKKQAMELLAKLASLPQTKELSLNELKKLDFSEDAMNITLKLGNKVEYQDPDSLSLYLYMAWGRFLIKKGILNDYNVVYRDYSLAIEGKYENNNRDNITVFLASDGIPIKIINKKRYEKNIYKCFGSFLIWPCHKKSINQKKGWKAYGINESIQKLMEKIKDYYEDKDQNIIEDPIDIEWMDHLGSINKGKRNFDSFLWSLELEGAEYDDIGILTKDCIKARNEKMWGL